MDTLSLAVLFLIASEPMSLDVESVKERIRHGDQLARENSALMNRARTAGPDVASQVVKCYHPTATFTGYKIAGHLQSAWQEGASHSLVMDAGFDGVTGSHYVMRFALVGRLGLPIREATARIEVLSDNAFAPPSKECKLGEWAPLTF